MSLIAINPMKIIFSMLNRAIQGWGGEWDCFSHDNFNPLSLDDFFIKSEGPFCSIRRCVLYKKIKSIKILLVFTVLKDTVKKSEP